MFKAYTGVAFIKKKKKKRETISRAYLYLSKQI